MGTDLTGAGGSDCFSFSRSLALVTLVSGSRVTDLITDTGRLSSAARRAASVAGLTPFTGEVTRLAILRLALGVLIRDTLGEADTLGAVLVLVGDSLDLSRRDSASLSSSLSALLLTGLRAVAARGARAG